MSETIKIKPPVDPKNPNYYVDKLAFNKALKEYKVACLAAEEAGNPVPQVSSYIGECILNIARGYAQLHKFRGYSFVNDMVSDGVYTCLRYIRSYDPDRTKSNGEPTSALSYFTQTCHWAFVERIKIEGKQTRVKRALVKTADIETFSQDTDEAGEEFRVNLVEFLKSLGTDDEELDAKIKKSNEAAKEDVQKPGPLDDFLE